jgi:hypothetical protein
MGASGLPGSHQDESVGRKFRIRDHIKQGKSFPEPRPQLSRSHSCRSEPFYCARLESIEIPAHSFPVRLRKRCLAHASPGAEADTRTPSPHSDSPLSMSIGTRSHSFGGSSQKSSDQHPPKIHPSLTTDQQTPHSRPHEAHPQLGQRQPPALAAEPKRSIVSD